MFLKLYPNFGNNNNKETKNNTKRNKSEEYWNYGADIYVTADLKYHDFYRAEGKVVLADIGHYESEQFTKNILVEYLTKKITNFAPALPEGRIILSKINTNPINYF